MSTLRNVTSRRVASFACCALLTASCALTGSTGSEAVAGSMRPESDLSTEEPVTQRGTTGAEEARIGAFQRRRAMDHVRALAGRIGVRVRATDGERRGARYTKRQFEDLGYEVFVQKFSVDGGTSRNVVAQWPGARR
jgi:hypothetical protein